MKKTIWEIEIWLLYHIMMVPGWDMISETLTFFWHYTLNDITGMGYALHPIGYSVAYFTTNHTPIIRHIHTMKKKNTWQFDQIHKSHNASVPYPIMHCFQVTEMCTCVHISVTKWCIVGYLGLFHSWLSVCNNFSVSHGCTAGVCKTL